MSGDRTVPPAGAPVPAHAAVGAGTARTARPRRRVLSIRWIVTGTTVLLTAAAVLSVGVVSERHARRALSREMETRTLLLARNLALTSSGALLGDFPELTLQPVVKEMLTRQPELAFVTVADHRGVIQGDADVRRLGTPYADPADLAPLPAAAGAPAEGTLRANRDLLVARVPVLQPGAGAIGAAYVGLRRDHIERTLAAARRQQAWVTLMCMALAVGAAFLMMSRLLRSVGVLRQGIERIGRGDLDTPIALASRTEIGLLAETVDEMAAALKRAQAEMVERERLAHEVELARQIQQSLLPRAAHDAGSFRIRGDHRAAAEVGGDYFDVLPLGDGRVGIAVADVAGKGLAGCLVMSMLSALLRALRGTCPSPAMLLEKLDERLGESLRPGVFVTMFYGILDPAAGRLIWASAGHNPLLVWRRATGEVETLTSRGMPLAAIRGGAIRRTLEDAELRIDPGDVVVQYTDGYTEACGADGESLFGLERVREAVARHGPQGGEAVRRGLNEALRSWQGTAPQGDDETLVVLDAANVAAAGAGAEAVALLERAERHGQGIELRAQLGELQPALRDWLAGLPALRALGREESDWLLSALYEICANVAEHGLKGDAGRVFQLWWLSGPDDPAASGRSLPERAAWRLRDGCFVLCDDGSPFHPEGWRESDFHDPDVRRRGRGIGLDIIHRVMRQVAYHPATPRGNITLLNFGPRVPATDGPGVTS